MFVRSGDTSQVRSRWRKIQVHPGVGCVFSANGTNLRLLSPTSGQEEDAKNSPFPSLERAEGATSSLRNRAGESLDRPWIHLASLFSSEAAHGLHLHRSKRAMRRNRHGAAARRPGDRCKVVYQDVELRRLRRVENEPIGTSEREKFQVRIGSNQLWQTRRLCQPAEEARRHILASFLFSLHFLALKERLDGRIIKSNITLDGLRRGAQSTRPISGRHWS